MAQLLCRRDAAERHVRALMVVSPSPVRGLVLYRLDRIEQGSGQPSVADGAVIAFNAGILLWLAWLDVIDADTVGLRLRQQRATDVLGPVVAANDAWLAAPLDDLLQRPDHPR